MNFLTEHGIGSYEELESRLTAVPARRDTAHAEIKRIENRAAELALVMKHAETYRQLKPLYDRYRIFHTIYRNILASVMYPKIHDTRIPLCLTHFFCNCTTTFGMFNPELTDTFIRIRKRQVT